MREGPSAAVISGAHRWRSRIASWKGTDLLAERVPLTGGELTANATQDVPERLTFTVPEVADGFSWVPDSDEHPLAEFGQFVDVDVDVWSSVTAGAADAPPTATSPLGRFQIQDWEHDRSTGTVTVECVGLLQKPKDAGFRTPMVPRPSGTFVTELRRLMLPGMPVLVDAALTDRAVPQSMVWGEDRLGALYDLADAWPALLRVDSSGVVRLLPPLPAVPTPVLAWTNGENGTVISAPRSGTRDGIANVVIARSTATDDPGKAPLQQVAQVTSGPLRPEVYGEVTYVWSSPLATTNAQLLASAQTILGRKSRPALVRKVTCVPDPRVELDDAASVTTEDGTDVGFVVGYRLPLTAKGGAMTVDVGVS
ncbi:MAG: hypothetical protein IE926_01930 [Micrococcales bacterium]|nr:hypothetical protein [Micrococcales bacterium]